MCGRLFQRLEQRVERCRRQHVHLVDDVNFEARLWPARNGRFAQLAHFLDPAVARGVHLKHIETVSAGDLPAIIAYAARRHCRPV